MAGHLCCACTHIRAWTHGLDDGREDAHAAGVGLALVDEEDGEVELLGHARLWGWGSRGNGRRACVSVAGVM